VYDVAPATVGTEYTTAAAPLHTVLVDVVKALGCAGTPETVTAIDCAVLVPHEFVAVTLNVPFVALDAKFIEQEFVVPMIVAPEPLYDHM
jgi:hypothetical protein